METKATQNRRRCLECKQSFPESHYSKSQLKKPKPKCQDCINASNASANSKSNAINSASANKSPKPNNSINNNVKNNNINNSPKPTNNINSNNNNNDNNKVLCIDVGSMSLCDLYGPNNETVLLFKKAFPSLIFVDKLNEAQTLLSDPVKYPIALIISLDFKNIKKICLVDYVRKGGCAILCGTFSSNIRMDHLCSTFTLFDLPWTNGEYHRTTYNATSTWKSKVPALSSKPVYCVKAQHLENVKFEDYVYAPTESSKVQSLVFAPSSVDLLQCPFAFTRVGYGYLGYAGDVNVDTMTTAIVIDLVKWRLSNPSSGGSKATEYKLPFPASQMSQNDDDEDDDLLGGDEDEEDDEDEDGDDGSLAHKVNNLETKLEEFEMTSQCVICLAEKKDHVCLPCSHLVCCSDCSSVVRESQYCPLCRQSIQSLIKIFT